MKVPADFRVGFPKRFSQHVSNWLFGKEEPKVEGLDGQWVRLEGGPLPLPVVLRVDRAADGRFLVTGLLIGLNDRREITWDTLRSIKPATLLSLIFSGFNPKDPGQLHRDTAAGFMKSVQTVKGEDFDVRDWETDQGDAEPLVVVGSGEWREHLRERAAFELWMQTGGPVPAAEGVQEVTRPRASVATNLTEFAETYLRHYAANRRRATTATAEELYISRATAIRRIAECRELGLLPPKGAGE